MRRLLLTFFFFVIIGAGLALLFRDDSGYLLISFAGWQLETSLLFAAVALLIALWILFTVWRLLVAGAFLPRNTRKWMGRRRARKARRAMYSGLLKYAEGRWAQAERDMQKRAQRNESPGLNYLYAAQAAQRQGHSADRDRYLELAAAQKEVSELAVMLTQAQLQIEQGQHDQAQASLTRLHEIAPQHAYVLELYAEQCARTRDYDKLRALIPALYKHSKMKRKRVDTLAAGAWDDAFRRAGTDVEALNQAWKKVPRRLHKQPAVVAPYARYLHAAGADDEAARLVRRVLKREWDPALGLLYGDLKTRDPVVQLANIEKWLKQYGEEPELLLSAGRLCLRNDVVGRARSYFEASLKRQSRPEALLELGRVFEELDEEQEARTAYRQGLELRLPPS